MGVTRYTKGNYELYYKELLQGFKNGVIYYVGVPYCRPPGHLAELDVLGFKVCTDFEMRGWGFRQPRFLGFPLREFGLSILGLSPNGQCDRCNYMRRLKKTRLRPWNHANSNVKATRP